MDIFGVLSLIGGLAIFLYGMDLLGEGLTGASGGKLEKILEKLTSSPIKAVLLGAGVTAVIQSSSATTVMVVGFVNSGIMKLSQAVGVIMGANIGTTITSWILSLTGIESSNIFISLLKPTSFSPVLAAVGIIFLMFLKKDSLKNPGKIMIGFALLMYGMDAMSSSVAPLAEVPQFASILTAFSNPVLGMLAGMLFTAIIQSSSASVGILQALCSTGILSYATALPIIMGQNIGTCVTALLSSIGATKNGKRAAIIHLYFNVIGTVTFMIVFYALNAVIHFSFLNLTAQEFGIAVIHTTFNIITTAYLLPLRKVLEKLAYATIKLDDDEKRIMDRRSENEFALLDDRFLEAPSLAVEHCKQVINKMADISRESLFISMSLIGGYDEEQALRVGELETRADKYEDALGTYIMKISTKNLKKEDSEMLNVMLHCIGDFERISDHACNICDSARELQQKNMQFSPKAETELDILSSAVREAVDISFDAFKSNSKNEADKVEPLEELIETLAVELKARHIRRLREGKCTIELGFAHSDILNNLERVADHCSNIAVDVIQSDQLEFDAHEYLDGIKNKDNQQFARDYKAYKEKYRLPETRSFQ
ncbi:MAG TPA: Na/Pi cotransporter [Eubacterium sp.]|jgi:phosphate:Na+ symporter|uniref:Na/Pi cotransporter family protein n=1 Tax=Lachnospira sp. TaxID=2049031 RepID=UPI000E891BBE|nr:Na/Pi cotransporter [Eubacterium sp.]